MRTNVPTPCVTHNPRSCRAPLPPAGGVGSRRRPGEFCLDRTGAKIAGAGNGAARASFSTSWQRASFATGGFASTPRDARSLLPDADAKRLMKKPVLESRLPRSRKTCRTGPKTSAGGAPAAARRADSRRGQPAAGATLPRSTSPAPRPDYERTNVSRETSCRRANGCSETDDGTRRTMRTAEQDSGLGCRSRPSTRQRRTRTAHVASAWTPSAKELGAEEVRQACSSLALNEMVRGVSRSSNATS